MGGFDVCLRELDRAAVMPISLFRIARITCDIDDIATGCIRIQIAAVIIVSRIAVIACICLLYTSPSPRDS